MEKKLAAIQISFAQIILTSAVYGAILTMTYVYCKTYFQTNPKFTFQWCESSDQ